METLWSELLGVRIPKVQSQANETAVVKKKLVRWEMKKKIYLFIVIAILFSCVSQKNDVQVNSSTVTTGNNEGGTIIKIDNPTNFNVYFSNGQRVTKKIKRYEYNFKHRRRCFISWFRHSL